MIVETIIDYHQLSCRLNGVPCCELASDRDDTYLTKESRLLFAPLSLQTSWFAGRAKLQGCGRRAEKEEESQRTSAEIPTTYGQAFFVSSLSTLSSNTKKWMWATKSACTKTKNTGTRWNTGTLGNTGTLRNTLEQRNSLKTLVHRTKFDGVVFLLQTM